MENWEFFRQKVGEDKWVKLEATSPECPTGRYCIAARAKHRPQAVIDVEAVPLNDQGSGKTTKKYQHSCRLDQEGFAIIIREIELTPDLWQIQCCNNLLDALAGEDWQITFTLRVTLPVEQATIRWNREEETEEDLEHLRSRLLDDADQILEDIIAELFPQSPSLFSGNAPETTNSDYSLQLDQDILIAQTTKPIIISGQITTRSNPPHPKLRLKITLRDPRTGNIVAELFPRLRDQPFPLTFCYSLSIPSPCESYLLQGEITLCEATHPEKAQIYAHQWFTVSANWEKLQPFLLGAITHSSVSHPPAPLSPLSPEDQYLWGASSSRWRGVFPPQLSNKGKTKNKKKTPPALPKLPSQKITQPQEHSANSQPNQGKETSPSPEWELIPELAIITTDESKL